MEINNKAFTLTDLFEIAKSSTALNQDDFDIDKLSYLNKTKFFLAFERFMEKQYIELNSIEIQNETIAFIMESRYEIEQKEEDYETFTYLKIGDKEFDLSDLNMRWTEKFINHNVSRSDYKEHVKGEHLFNLQASCVEKILKSEFYAYMKKFNESMAMEKKFPPKESLLKKIINKI